ncbi:MAG: hypothetical protein DRO67_00555 [Candidatus Asgardarchaeum californiense]|nr:MAG: hypothetical protein DRO67_00555 [Candidatus Asgardarchaeum californiense]
MPNFGNDIPDEEYPGQYHTTEWEDDGTGGKVLVTRRSDGTSTVHWGGPVGDADYDEFGEEM